jgi:hypothetical protein
MGAMCKAQDHTWCETIVQPLKRGKFSIALWQALCSEYSGTAASPPVVMGLMIRVLFNDIYQLQEMLFWNSV